jgi:uncharacterized protein (DUF885 family)
MTPKPPAPPAPAQAQAHAAQVDALAHDVWEFGLDESPVSATFLGDPRGADRLDERGPAARARREKRLRELQQRLHAIPELPTTEEAGLTQRVLARSLADGIEEYRHHLWQIDVDQLFGPHLILAQVLAMQPIATPKDAHDVAARIRALEPCFAGWQGDLDEGLAAGRVPPRIAVERVLAQLAGLAEKPPEASPYAAPVRRLPATWSSADRHEASARIHDAIAEVARPACLKLHDSIEQRVLPRARTAPGLCHVPGGDAAYRWRVRSQTTTDLTPQQIHEIGREELEKNTREIQEIARSEGLPGDVPTFLTRIAADPRFRLATREQILERYRAICARMQARLPEWFGLLPKRHFEVKPIEAYAEKDAPAAYYQPGPEGREDPGVFYANTRDPQSWPTYDFEALCFHEAVPGHHLQIAIAQELPGLPAVRRHGGFNAYMEGWAHYTERFADEVGMYSSAFDRVGMLTAQGWRAARLVVDTGLHALGWTREQAIELMDQIRGGSPGDVRNEVDRYIVWPGQALSYKIGSRSITEIRTRTQARLGARFDLRGFHDEVLRHGALPLALLGEVLDRWMP